MIIKSRIEPLPEGYGILDARYDGDNLLLKHAEHIDPILKEAAMLRDFSDNGFTKDRNFRQIGTVPGIEFVRHPEWNHDPGLIRKWLMTEEGRPYRTVTKGI